MASLLSSINVTTTLLIALALLLAVGARILLPRKERCPDCHQVREDDSPICACGWIFEMPDDASLDYGDPDDDEI